MKKTFSTKKLALLGMLAAFVFASNYARVTLPVPIGGYQSFTLANIVCILSGLILGPIGGLASGLGSALYDLTNPLWAAECWITFITKGAMGLMAGMAMSRMPKRNYMTFLISAVVGCLTYYALYYTKQIGYNGMLLGGLEFQAAAVVSASKIPSSLFNGSVAIILAPPLTLALDKAMEKSKIML